MSQKGGNYRLYGFPQNVTFQQIKDYLPQWLYGKNRMLSDLRKHRKSSSVLFTCPNFTDLNGREYKRLCKFLVETHFEGDFIVSIKKEIPTSTSNTNSKNKRKKRKDKDNDVPDALTLGFVEFIVFKKKVSICDREEVSTLFQEFCSKTPSFRDYLSSSHELKKREMFAVTNMRRRGFMKTERINNFCVLALFLNPMTSLFPTSEELLAAAIKNDSDQQDAQINKGGVTISELEDRITGAVGKVERISFDLQVLDDDTRATLTGVEVKGPHHFMFQLTPDSQPMPQKLSQSMNDKLTIQLTVKPQRISLLRAKVYFKFDGFVIVRGITMSCGRAEMNSVLQQASPYKRRQFRSVFKEATNIIGLPPQSQRFSNAENPFQTLAYYSIPEQVRDSLVKDALDNMIDANDWDRSASHDTIEGYGNNWKLLLWASEYQTQKDIQMYDMDNVHLRRDGRYFLFTVPGLAEGRPSVLRGDLVHITCGDTLYKGRVVTTNLLEVALDLHSNFAAIHTDALRVSVRFTFSRMTFRTSHKACDSQAEKEMGAMMLVPTQEHVEEVMRMNDKASCPICFEEIGVDGETTTSYCQGQCKKQFHERCIQRWLGEEQQRSQPTCPMCRDPWVGGIATRTRQGATNSDTQLAPWANRGLNPEQQAAIKNIANGALKPLPYIIFGPPGTGKTTTVVETIYQLGKKGKKILLVAPSNDAADILVERLSSYFPPSELRRILAYSRSIESVPQSIRDYSQDSLQFKEQAAEIMSAQIVVSTVNLAARFSFWGIPRGHFEVLCVDEAGHATEPEVVSVASSLMDFKDQTSEKVGQLILAGDPKQLGPITSSDICLKYGLSVSYMERLTERSVYQPQENGKYPEKLLAKLVRNYRSHPAILKLPNEMFYKDLQCRGDIFVTSNMTRWEYLQKPGFPIVFHSMNGQNLREGNSPSWFNPEEAQQVCEYVRLLMKETRPPILSHEIGIITPYARQAQKIRSALRIQDIDDIKVGSVECFQGQERRVIIMSTVRAEREQVKSDIRFNLGFVASPKRFNVAVTRAKALLIVVGCPSILAMDKDNWLPFLKYCHENQAWAGEDWDPSSADDDESEDSETSGDTTCDEFEIVDAPSQVAQQAAFAFINREE